MFKVIGYVYDYRLLYILHQYTIIAKYLLFFLFLFLFITYLHKQYRLTSILYQ